VYNWSQAREFHLPCSGDACARDWLKRLWGSPCGSFEKEHHEAEGKHGEWMLHRSILGQLC
jgi:hypothetical protein